MLEEHLFGAYPVVVVADGSQRLVCISLLMLAAIRAVDNGLLTLKRPQRIDEVRNRLLVAEDAPGDCRAKLLLGLREGEVYSRMVEALERMLPSLHEEVTLALANESGNRWGYLPVLEYQLTHRNNNMELPDDKRFRNALLTRNADTFLRLYSYPMLSYGMAPTSVNTSTSTSTKGTSPAAASAKAPKALEVKSPTPSSAVNPLAVKGRVEELRLNNTKVSPVSRKLKGFRLFGKEYADNTWKRMVIHVVQLLAEQYPDAVERLYDREPSFKRGNLSS